jgi:hypothetical protein
VSLKYTDLVEVDLGKLGAAVGDWKTAVGHLKTLASEAETGMQKKARAAQWEGVNSDVTRPFIDKTAKEIGDLHSEGDSIYQVLDDAHRELLQLQRSVRQLVTDAKNNGFIVRDNGNCTVTVIEYLGAGEPSKEGATEKAQHYADQISTKVGHADEIDQSVKLALTRAHGDDPNNAGYKKYGSLNDAQAERAAELAKKGDKMSDTELAEFNRIMKYNGREPDGEFSTKFFQKLGGPEKTLDFYAQMATDGTESDAGKTRLNEVKELQVNLGNALANATDPDAPKGYAGKKFHLDDSWGAEFRRLGTQQIAYEDHLTRKPYGYQVLGGILRYGNYDPRFLDPIAEHITQLHQEDPARFQTFIGNQAGENYGFNPSGKIGTGQDPMNSVLEALGHSPEASEKFFTDPPTAYNEDGTVKTDGKLDFKNYLDLYTDKDFQWNADTTDPGFYGDDDKALAARNVGPTALGHALESATTGRPYDSDATADAIRHTPARADLVEKIVDKFGSDPDLIRHNESGDSDEHGPLYAMRGSLGDITAEYMGDFQRGLSGSHNSMFDPFGAPADLHGNTASRFLAEVGQDPHAYASITSAQQAYTANVVNDVLNGHSDTTVSDAERLRDATHPGGVIAGIMSQSRADAVLDYHTASDSDFNEAAADKQKWVDRILGMGVDKAAESVPILGAPIAWASEDIQESVMKSIEQDSSDQAETDATRTYSKGREAVMDSARAAVDAAARQGSYNVDTLHDLEDAAAYGADNGHSAGANLEDSGDAS